MASGCSLPTQIQLRKHNKLTINNGIYQSLAGILPGKMKLPARLINPARSIASEYQGSTIPGPIGDNLDILPAPLN